MEDHARDAGSLGDEDPLRGEVAEGGGCGRVGGHIVLSVAVFRHDSIDEGILAITLLCKSQEVTFSVFNISTFQDVCVHGFDVFMTS